MRALRSPIHPPVRSLWCVTGIVSLCLAASSCGSGESAPAASPPTFKFPIHAVTKTVQGDPLPGIPVLLTLGGEDAETKTIGYTDKNGEFGWSGFIWKRMFPNCNTTDFQDIT